MRRRGDHEPTVTTDAEVLAKLNEPVVSAHPYLTPPEPSDAKRIGKLLLAIIGVGAGVYELDTANGGHLFRHLFAPSLSCSDPRVLNLARQVLRDQLPNTEAGIGVDAPRTGVTLDAIRTRSTESGSVACAAHVRLDLAYTPLFRMISQARSEVLSPSRDLDITYKAEVTDDHEHVYVTVTIGDD